MRTQSTNLAFSLRSIIPEIQLEVNRYPLVLRCYVYNDEALAFSGIDAAILLANAEEVTNERFKLYGKAAQKWAKPACKGELSL